MNERELEQHLQAMEAMFVAKVRDGYLPRWRRNLRDLRRGGAAADDTALLDYFAREFADFGALIAVNMMSQSLFRSTHFREALDKIDVALDAALDQARAAEDAAEG